MCLLIYLLTYLLTYLQVLLAYYLLMYENVYIFHNLKFWSDSEMRFSCLKTLYVFMYFFKLDMQSKKSILIKYNFQNIVANHWIFPFRHMQPNPTIINNKKDNLEVNNFILELSVMAAKEKYLDLGTNVWPVLIMICASVVKLKEST